MARNSDVFDLHGQNIADVLASVSGNQTEASGAYLIFNESNHTLYYDAHPETAGGNPEWG
ncbi:MAG: hypothetical protein RSE29_01145 [Leclercia sp.]